MQQGMDESPFVFGSTVPQSRYPWIAAGALSLAAVLLVFILPLFVPLKPMQAVSASYLAGFNNSVATALAALLSGLAFGLTLWLRRRRGLPLLRLEMRQNEPLGRGFITGVTLVSATVLAICAWMVVASHLRYLGDAGYIIEQATAERETGRALYTQLEFAYGPLLILPEIWVSELLGCSVTVAYYLTFVLESSLGLLALAYVLNAVPMRTSLRKAAFALLAIGAITPHLGMNYTFFRFVSPLAVLLGATGTRSLPRCVLLLSLGEVAVVLISPELGFALAAGVVTFGLLRAWEDGWRWLLAAVLPVAVLGTLLLTLGRPFLAMAATFSRGALNLPVGPYPHILVFLFALVWLVPFGLARFPQLRGFLGSRLLALYAVSLAFLPAALGRCDPLHVLFNGTGVLVLSLVGVSGSSRRARIAWLTAIAVLVFWNQFVDEQLFEAGCAQVLRQSLLPHLPSSAVGHLVKVVGLYRQSLADILAQKRVPDLSLDAAELDRLVGGAPIATPLEIPPSLEQELKDTHHYSQSYFAFWVDMMNPQTEERSIRDVNACPWMLLPRGWIFNNPHTPGYIAEFQGFSLPYRTRNAALYLPGLAFQQNLKQHWTAVQDLGPYVLYKQTKMASAAPVVPQPSRGPA